MAFLQETIKDYIARGKLEEALDLLRAHAQLFDERDQQSITLLSGQLYSWNTSELNGLQPPASEKARIRLSVLQLLQRAGVDVVIELPSPTLSPPAPPPPAIEGRITILFLQANPTTEAISWEKEYTFIEKKLMDEERYRLKRTEAASIDNLIDAVEDYEPQIIHFCGHGKEDQFDAQGGRIPGGLVFHNEAKNNAEILTAETLERQFKALKEDFPQLHLVFLNGCHTQEQARAISKNGIYTVGTTDEITSDAARNFAAGFYRRYAKNQDLLAAVKAGISRSIRYDADVAKNVLLFFNGDSLNPPS